MIRSDFVRVRDYIPDIFVELKYASEDNFTGHRIYDFTEAYLRYGTVLKLKAVQDKLRPLGLSLKIWDAYRPVSAQFVFWEICPDDTYVADPYRGFSSHSRGNAVDVTLVTVQGKELPMPTAFDDFTGLAARNYSAWSQEAAANVMLVEWLMAEQGFRVYMGEWWHYVDSERYPVEEKLKL